MTIADGTAYGEPFATAIGGAALRGQRRASRRHRDARRAAVAITGAAYVGWNGTYSFNADGRGVAVETLALTTYPGYPPLTGAARFLRERQRHLRRAALRRQVRRPGSVLRRRRRRRGDRAAVGARRVADLRARGRIAAPGGVGHRPHRARRRDGRGAVVPRHRHLARSVRARRSSRRCRRTRRRSPAAPSAWSASSTTPTRCASIRRSSNSTLALVDYRLRNPGPIQLERRTADAAGRHPAAGRRRHRARPERDGGPARSGAVAAGQRRGQSRGAAGIHARRAQLRSRRRLGAHRRHGRPNPWCPARRCSPRAASATSRFPHALEELNGVVTFNASGIRLDGVTAPAWRRRGALWRSHRAVEVPADGVRRHGHRRRHATAVPGRHALGGRRHLALQGPAAAPHAQRQRDGQERELDPRRSTPRRPVQRIWPAATLRLPWSKARCTAAASNVRYDVRISAPSTLRIENDQARIVASTDLNLRGTFDRPLLFGRADIERGEVRFEGRRYQVTRGSLDFTNPNRIQPFFDIEAETRVRVPGQTYRVTLRMAGTTERMQPEFTSDPPLPPLDILTLLFSDFGAERRHRAGRAAAAQPAAAAAARGARHPRADRRPVGRSRTRRRADLRRRHVPDHAAADRSLPAVDQPERQSDRARHHRQAHFRSHLPHLRAQPVVLDARRDHPARVRPERIVVVGAVAERGSHLRARSAKEARILMRRGARRLAALLVLSSAVASLVAAVAAAEQAPHLGRIVTDVRVEIAGQPVIDPDVLGLIETRIGEPLQMQAVRSTIDHLVGLGRFEDVRVFALTRRSGRDRALAADAGAPDCACDGVRQCRPADLGHPVRAHRSLRRDAVSQSRRRHGDDPAGLLCRSRFSTCHDPAAHRRRGPCSRARGAGPHDRGRRADDDWRRQPYRHAARTGAGGAGPARPSTRPPPTTASAIEARIAAYEESTARRAAITRRRSARAACRPRTAAPSR